MNEREAEVASGQIREMPRIRSRPTEDEGYRDVPDHSSVTRQRLGCCHPATTIGINCRLRNKTRLPIVVEVSSLEEDIVAIVVASMADEDM
jgi:hypothetical protein